MHSFAYNSSKVRILFGAGTFQKLPDERDRMGLNRILVLSTAAQRDEAMELANIIKDSSVGVFSEAVMHTPVNTTEKAVSIARNLNADGILSIGGGSTTGLSKAIALRTGLPQIIVPTTYAGSEVTPILGQTENGSKTTIRDPGILPDLVIYDPNFSMKLPVELSITSGLNAMAHALEGLYAQDRNPISSLMAIEGLRALHSALPAIQEIPDDKDARTSALFGSWLCGTVLGTVGMSLHHKICHTLGGMFDLPHAETHAILLPYTIAYNSEVAAMELAPLQDLFGPSIPAGIFDFSRRLGAPYSLAQLGLVRRDIERAAEQSLKNAYWNPRRLERQAIQQLLEMALEGARPR